MNASPSNARTELIADLTDGLGRLFPPDERHQHVLVTDSSNVADKESTGKGDGIPLADAALLEGESRSALAWQYRGIDTVGLNGLAPTKLPVVIRGVTIYNAATRDFDRYIDWLDVYTQLGYTMIARAGIDPNPG